MRCVQPVIKSRGTLTPRVGDFVFHFGKQASEGQYCGAITVIGSGERVKRAFVSEDSGQSEYFRSGLSASLFKGVSDDSIL